MSRARWNNDYGPRRYLTEATPRVVESRRWTGTFPINIMGSAAGVQAMSAWNFSWRSLCGIPSRAQSLLQGPSYQDFTRAKVNAFYMTLLASDRDLCIFKVDLNQNTTIAQGTMTAKQIMDQPGSTLVFKTEQASSVRTPGKWKSVFKPAEAELGRWNTLLNSDRVAGVDNWMDQFFARYYCTAFDVTNAALTYTLAANESWNMIFKIDLYFNVGDPHFGVNSRPIDREAALLDTEIALHRAGVSDCIDLTLE